MTALTGYQSYEEWKGTRVLSLRDVWPEHPRAAIVGINPSPGSVAAGHYFQGPVGRRQLRRIADALGWDVPDNGYFEEAGLAQGVGFTDMVKRPTPREVGVSAAELAHGRDLLAIKLASRHVRLVIAVYRQPVLALLGAEGKPGVQPTRTSWGAQVFRMPGPFETPARADEVMQGLVGLLDT
jgi:TDG/mug DNA glycosylase family protein